MSNDLKEVLAERGSNYGDFTTQSELSQEIKRAIANHMDGKGIKMRSFMWEGMEMIIHKISRIANGNPYHADSWRDIAGYATLVSDRVAEFERAETPNIDEEK